MNKSSGAVRALGDEARSPPEEAQESPGLASCYQEGGMTSACEQVRATRMHGGTPCMGPRHEAMHVTHRHVRPGGMRAGPRKHPGGETVGAGCAYCLWVMMRRPSSSSASCVRLSSEARDASYNYDQDHRPICSSSLSSIDHMNFLS